MKVNYDARTDGHLGFAYSSLMTARLAAGTFLREIISIGDGILLRGPSRFLAVGSARGALVSPFRRAPSPRSAGAVQRRQCLP
jgi:hypothetical protein